MLLAEVPKVIIPEGAIDMTEDRVILDIVAEAHLDGAMAVLVAMTKGENVNPIDLPTAAREYAEKHYG